LFNEWLFTAKINGNIALLSLCKCETLVKYLFIAQLFTRKKIAERLMKAKRNSKTKLMTTLMRASVRCKLTSSSHSQSRDKLCS